MNTSKYESLKQMLSALNREYDDLVSSGRAFQGPNGRQESNRLAQSILETEREIAKISGLEYADSLEWDIRWTRSTNFATLFRSDCRAYLIYDNIISDKPSTEQVAVVKLGRCYGIRCGGLNDEVQDGHRLSGRGFHSCAALVVMNSSWISDEAKANANHVHFDSREWGNYQHIIWTFHDGMVEAIVEYTTVNVVSGSICTVLQRIHESTDEAMIFRNSLVPTTGSSPMS